MDKPGGTFLGVTPFKFEGGWLGGAFGPGGVLGTPVQLVVEKEGYEPFHAEISGGLEPSYSFTLKEYPLAANRPSLDGVTIACRSAEADSPQVFVVEFAADGTPRSYRIDLELGDGTTRGDPFRLTHQRVTVAPTGVTSVELVGQRVEERLGLIDARVFLDIDLESKVSGRVITRRYSNDSSLLEEKQVRLEGAIRAP